MNILIVNPPIYDFSAYDFWIKPYGLLRTAGFLRGKANFKLFDFLDRSHPSIEKSSNKLSSDEWGRGRFPEEKIKKPSIFSDIPRYFRRWGLLRKVFQNFLRKEGPFDYVFIQTLMTYWYPGVKEVIEELKSLSPASKIVLGGVYATICPIHAQNLGADLVISDSKLSPLFDFLKIKPDFQEPPLWEAYKKLDYAVTKLTDGCPFHCTYCAIHQFYPHFKARPIDTSLSEIEFIAKLGPKNIAFYDDALLFQPQNILIPFLKEVVRRNYHLNFHTPNALNARFIDQDIAQLLVQSGFKTFYLGFESNDFKWQKQTGGKIFSEEFENAVRFLIEAGAQPKNITAYIIFGHPNSDLQNIEASMNFVHSLGIRIMLSDFSPIPGTPDGELCKKWINLDEPLFHNKTAFPYFLFGKDKVGYFKDLCRDLNASLI